MSTADPDLQAVLKDLASERLLVAFDLSLQVRSRLYGFPQMPDLVVNYYRKDVFCDPTEQKNFMAKYNYKLPCSPEEMDQITWDNYRDFGEFFQRKKGDMLMGKPLDDDFFGIEFQVGKGYDFFTTSAYEFLWQHGGDIWDETKQPNAHAVGVMNSPEAVKSFEHLLSFVKYFPPEGTTGNLDIFKTDELFRAGKVASNLEWIGFAESSIHPDTSKVVGQNRLLAIAGPQDRQGDCALVGDRRSAVCLDDLEHGPAEQGGARLRQVVDVERYADRLREGRWPERARSRSTTTRSYVTFRPWNRTWAESLDVAKGLLARAGILRAADRAAGGIHQGGDGSAGRQDHARQHRQLPGEDAERGGPHQVANLSKASSSAPPKGRRAPKP